MRTMWGAHLLIACAGEHDALPIGHPALHVDLLLCLLLYRLLPLALLAPVPTWLALEDQGANFDCAPVLFA